MKTDRQLCHLPFKAVLDIWGSFKRTVGCGSRRSLFVTSPCVALKAAVALLNFGAGVSHALHPRELCVHPSCASLRRPRVLTEVFLVVVRMEKLLLSHRRVVWLHEREVTVPVFLCSCSWAMFASCFNTESPLAFWHRSRMLGYFADGILMRIDRR